MSEPARILEPVRGTALPAGRVEIDGKFFRVGAERLFVRGVTYGPFKPDLQGDAFPSVSRVRSDFARIRDLGANTVRTFTPPPIWMLDEARRAGLWVIAGIPWSQHVCFLEEGGAARDARERVAHVAKSIGEHAAMLALLIGNETPPDVVRWERPDRVARFLFTLAETVREHAPQTLVSYANFPPTEYLDLDCVDFLAFNVYLEREADLRRYLARLQNLADDRPLLLTEIGLDSARSSEAEQANGLAMQLDVAFSSGVAGAVVFSFTDEWFSLDAEHDEGGFYVDDWAFGLVDRERAPKEAADAVKAKLTAPIPPPLVDPPLASVVVCAFNEERTLDACLTSLAQLSYPRFEIVVVDDGSSDGTAAIADRHRGDRVRVVHQPNGGLSAARNRGIAEARGEIIAFTDADCVVDAAWLDYLVRPLERGFAAVGGPNLSPPERRLIPSIVAAAPGVPTHVLLDDDVAEHVPGCNMAFRRAALDEIGGFRDAYRVAGDDVDVCWRLQDAGHEIGFSPAAVVWHFRRESVGAYLAQQRGYGRAEALLSHDHPLRFNALGQSKWIGRVYGGLVESVLSRRPRIYHGVFGEGLFQTLYEHPSSVLRYLPLTLEWNIVAWTLLLIGAFSGDLLLWVAAPLLLTFFTAGTAAARARLSPPFDGWRARSLLAVLTYFGPLVRSIERTRSRAVRAEPSESHRLDLAGELDRVRLDLPRAAFRMAYWSENGITKEHLLGAVAALGDQHAFRVQVDSGWNEWDLEMAQGAWTQARLQAAIENHGGPRRLVRLRITLHVAGVAIGAIAACALAALGGVLLDVPAFAWAGALFGGAAALVVIGQNLRLARAVARAIRGVAEGLELVEVARAAEGGNP